MTQDCPGKEGSSRGGEVLDCSTLRGIYPETPRVWRILKEGEAEAEAEACTACPHGGRVFLGVSGILGGLGSKS